MRQAFVPKSTKKTALLFLPSYPSYPFSLIEEATKLLKTTILTNGGIRTSRQYLEDISNLGAKGKLVSSQSICILPYNTSQLSK